MIINYIPKSNKHSTRFQEEKDNSLLLILKISELKHLVAKFHLEISLMILILLKETV